MPRKPRDMSRESLRAGLGVEWRDREGFKDFGDRLDFLSPEEQHVTTGRLSILPPRDRPKKESV